MTAEVRRVPSRRFTDAVRVSLAALVLTGLVVCWQRCIFVRGHHVDVRLTYASAATTNLTFVNAISGADRESWAIIKPGASVQATLEPDGERPELLLDFKQAEQKVEWVGPALDQSRGYRISVDIDASGTIHERHCELPCWPL
jgi:hypothetical protein